MVIAIEPMINLGTYKVKDGEDGFSVVTKDSKLSAHFEHSLAITDSDPLIITNL
jgi:methionyl aminopeptidase